VLSGFLQEFAADLTTTASSTAPSRASSTSSTPLRRVAILFGAYHVNDLAYRLVEELGFIRMKDGGDGDGEGNSAVKKTSSSEEELVSLAPDVLTCWRIQAPVRKSLPRWCTDLASKILPGKHLTPRQNANAARDALGVSAVGLGLVLFGSLFYLLVGALDWLLLCDLLAKALQTAVNEGSGGEAHSSSEVVTSVAGLYLAFYIQRHLYLLRQIGAVGIQWDRGLFVDI
jgi:hypothetical protein